MKNTRFVKTFGLMLALISLKSRVNAQSNVTEFVPFNTFLEQTNEATASDHMTRATSRVKAPSAFEEMRQHILSMYRGVEVRHSFVLDSSHIDCVPMDQQPAARAFGITGIPEPPPQSLLANPSPTNDAAPEVPTVAASQFDPQKTFDEFGNSVGCEANTIPMRRLTLEEVAQFPTLGDFFAKGPGSAGQARRFEASAQAREADVAPTPAVDPTLNHRYAIMQQNVNNFGGSAAMNVWSPAVNTALYESMSLSQEWYVGGSGAATQTAEVGWQVVPGTYHTNAPVLFIYWTANHYDSATYPGLKGGGCYNLTCGAFYQYSNSVILGGPLTSSVAGGAQAELTARYYFSGGNWWLAINGVWVGCYPGTIYHGGQMSKYAQIMQFGTETVGTAGVWPAAGSGQWSNLGANHAAYQRDLYYTSTTGQSFWDTLTPHPLSKCYSLTGPSVTSTNSVFFYVGGPEGHGC